MYEYVKCLFAIVHRKSSSYWEETWVESGAWVQEDGHRYTPTGRLQNLQVLYFYLGFSFIILFNLLHSPITNSYHLIPDSAHRSGFVSVETVEQEHELLQALCGGDAAKFPLEYLEPAPGYAFAFENGCRAPPWRQLHGDIAYFVCLPRDAQEGKELPITASREGWFLNQVRSARRPLDQYFYF